MRYLDQIAIIDYITQTQGRHANTYLLMAETIQASDSTRISFQGSHRIDGFEVGNHVQVRGFSLKY